MPISCGGLRDPIFKRHSQARCLLMMGRKEQSVRQEGGRDLILVLSACGPAQQQRDLGWWVCVSASSSV